MIIKKSVPLVLAIILIVSLSTMALADLAPFEDYEDVKETDWFYECTRFVHEKGILGSDTYNMFYPSNPVTRGEFVSMLGRLANQLGHELDYGECNFEDLVPGSTTYNYVAWAYNNGIVNGYSDNVFSPNVVINREQMAKMIALFADALDIEMPYDSDILLENGDISEWALPSFSRCVTARILSGNEKGELSPKKEATRAEASKAIHNFATVCDLDVSDFSDITSE